jgi:hypothetical protein
MTEIELNVIAALAIIGLSRRPNHEYRIPAAIGTPVSRRARGALRQQIHRTPRLQTYFTYCPGFASNFVLHPFEQK